MTAAATEATVTTIDPATGETLATYAMSDAAAIDAALSRAVRGFHAWRTTAGSVRSDALRSLAKTLRAKKAALAELATREMGKTIVEAEAEVEKCAVGCEHYAEHGPAYLADEPAASSATESYVAFRPLGVLLAIMPWNFPFWQLFRAAAPAIAAGNVVVLKHAANVTGCALAIADVFREAGLPEGTFATIVVAGRDMERVVADPRIAAVTLTGSEAAGSSVASIAGKHLKKTVLELGGSDAFIVLADADIAAAAKMGVRARFQNNGQSCIAAKRFIVEAPVYDAFCEAFVAVAKELVIGNPLERTTTLGPVARGDLRDGLDAQVRDSVARGGRLALGGSKLQGPGYFYDATIVADVAPGMPVFDEETFGPVAAVMRARDADDAIALANASPYGLGGNLWTQDIARAKDLAARCESGAVFINGMTASDPRLPFGGVKLSGYGRELAAFGIREFVNVQTIWIGPSTDTSGAPPSE
jgi:succinate-semialdehyde dehydrogenase/glutarate-semialdehyde dehydrogenase